jgi:outer membrane receptor for ferrienterochelin and colicins
MSRWRTTGSVLALGALLALAPPARAQQREGGTVSGTVVDESGAILPGANVQLSGPGVNRFQITGPEGGYTFTVVPAGTYRVSGTLAGFGSASQDVTVSGTGTTQVPPITLKLAVRGEEVVVTASRAETSLVNAPATMTVVGSDVIQSSPAQNFGDLLRGVPGLNVIQMSARDVNMTSRQGTSTLSNSQLALLDGRSIYLDFFGLVLWDFVPSNPEEIKQIEVVRGPASAVWGANALTGVINIITKTPRESPGTTLTLSGGTFTRDAGSARGEDAGTLWGAGITHADAPNDTWSYRVSAGYFNSDPYPRPVGFVPGRITGTTCQQVPHPLSASFLTGCGAYPLDRAATRPGEQAFENRGTSQPKFDGRLDQDLRNGGRITYSGGYSGTEGIVHAGIGPFDLQSGSYLAYGRVAYAKGGLRVAGFGNFLDGDAPNLLSTDARTGRPLELSFKTQTYDLEAGNSNVLGGNNILTYGGNVRRNNFDLTIAPAAEDRTEFGAYVQDEFFFGRFRFNVGGRIDKFGNIDDPVFSPRITAMYKPLPSHALRASFNRAFRSPSAINNYLDVVTVTGAFPLGAVDPRLGAAQFPVVTRSVGSAVPQRGEPSGHPLKEESLTAYELGYTGTFGGDTTLGLAYYINDTDDNINFITDLCRKRYSAANPPAGWPLPAIVLELLAAQRGICLPAEFTYLNLGKLRNKGLEASIDHSFSRGFSAFANYSWQSDPESVDDNVPAAEISLPPNHRFNVGVNANRRRWLGSLSVSYTSEAFWTDVLGASFAGFTDSFTMVNATVGVKWLDGKLVTSLKGTNLLNDDNSQGGIQQHNFGDIITRTVVAEARLRF